MKQYESYKESGIEWIGRIPSHWICAPFKHYMQINNGRDYKHVVSEVGYPVIGSGGQFACASEYLYDGEALLLGRKGTIDRPIYINAKFWTVDTMFYAIPSSEVSCKYMYYQSLGFPFGLYATDTALPSMTQTALGENPICVPPLIEQQSIVSYLDDKVCQIEAVISGKKAMVEDLQNYRKSIITEIVTQGLNPDAPMKDSGIDWMGTIPEHWRIAKTSYLFEEIGSGTTPNTNNEKYYVEDGINWLQTGDLNDGYIEKTTKHISSKALEENSALRVYPKGSLVIAMYGATIGKVGILNIETTTNQACCVLANSKSLLGKYAYYAFIASKQSLVNLAFGGGQPNISQAIIRSHKLPVPPLEEQQAIVSYLDSKMQGFDFTISELQTQIEDLKSYKASLITEAVTGKIDLR